MCLFDEMFNVFPVSRRVPAQLGENQIVSIENKKAEILKVTGE